MPRVDELLDRLGAAKFISTLDFICGYWLVPVAEKDRVKTAFVTLNGLFRFKLMLFGLNGAPSTFQRTKNIVIFNGTLKDHIRHLREVLLRLKAANLKAKLKKCKFGMKECVYLAM